MKGASIGNPFERFSDLFGNLEFVAGDSRAVRHIVENLDPFIRSRNKKMLYYLRIYSSLLYADSYFERGNIEKAKYYLELALNTELREKMPAEEKYAAKIRSLIDYAMDQMKDPAAMPDKERLRTRIHIAQNVCVLRMLYT